MKGRLESESPTPFVGFQRFDHEHVLFCASTDKQVGNPLDGNRKHAESAVVTDQRVVVLSTVSPHPFDKLDAVSTIPLNRITAVQCTYVHWNTARVLACIMAFIFYIIPGIVYVVWMSRNVGPRVDVVSGVFRIHVKFHKDQPGLFKKFLSVLQREGG